MRYSICLFIKCALSVLSLIILFSGNAVATISFSPHFSTALSYSDNLDLIPENERHDYITTVSPGFDLIVTGRLSDLALSYTPSYATYLRFPENNTLRHNASLSASRQMSRTSRLELSHAYLYTEDPLEYQEYREEPISEIDSTVRQGRQTYTSNSTELGYVNEFGAEDSVALRYAYNALEHSNPADEDSETHRPSLGFTWWPVQSQYGTETELSYIRRYFDDSEDYNDAAASFRLIRRLNPHLEYYFEYTHELTEYVGGSADYQVYSPVVGFSWDEYVNSSISGSFGYFFQDSDGSESESGAVGSVETTYRWANLHSISFSGSVGYDRADTGAENLGFNTFYNVAGGLDYQLARLLAANFSVSFRRSIYTEEEPDREDSLLSSRIGLSYQMLPWAALSVSYEFRDLDSTQNENDYTENRAFISITMSPRQPVRLSR